MAKIWQHRAVTDMTCMLPSACAFMVIKHYEQALADMQGLLQFMHIPGSKSGLKIRGTAVTCGCGDASSAAALTECSRVVARTATAGAASLFSGATTCRSVRSGTAGGAGTGSLSRTIRTRDCLHRSESSSTGTNDQACSMQEVATCRNLETTGRSFRILVHHNVRGDLARTSVGVAVIVRQRARWRRPQLVSSPHTSGFHVAVIVRQRAKWRRPQGDELMPRRRSGSSHGAPRASVGGRRPQLRQLQAVVVQRGGALCAPVADRPQDYLLARPRQGRRALRPPAAAAAGTQHPVSGSNTGPQPCHAGRQGRQQHCSRCAQ